MERQVDRIEGRLASIESRHPSESSTLRVTRFDKGITDSINDIRNLLQKLDDRMGELERKIDGEEGGKALVEFKSKDLAATVSGVPVVGLVIGLWITVVVYILYI